ncbi:helix-turn-helix domain-containing protein [Cohnella panacarvi]|uniref:helix-turn-helix domain-containing protein n=1 Tax=Cohnella panacarvi TaxID=400776 RepID=UPI00047B58F8|nr:helix-turn-helix transcriptional regulator [Cohnella panacarvi]
MTMGDRLRALRLQKKISQGEVARYIGITRSAYSHYEINNRQPVYDTLIKLSAYFDVSLDYIIGGSTGKTKPETPEVQETNEVLDLLKHMSHEQRMQSIHLLRDLIRQRNEESG